MKSEKLKIKALERVSLVGLFVVCFVASFAGCRVPTHTDVLTTDSETRLVTDDLGRTLTIPAHMTRVVSLAPNLTESIFAVGAGDRLVGVTTFCDYPEQARSIAKVGDTLSPNMETIVALKPDIVFVSTASQIETFMKTLETNGIAVYVMGPDSLDKVFKNLIQLGEIFEKEESAQNLVAELRGRTEAVKQANNKAEPMRVFVQISKEPLFTIGKRSFLTEVVESAGGRSVTSDIETAYPKLSKETALAYLPEVIILSESPDNEAPNQVFKNSPAVKNGRVYKINADIISRPGPRLVDALEQIARDLHSKSE